MEFFETMNQDEKEKFLQSCFDIFHKKSFQMVFEELKETKKNELLKSVNNMDQLAFTKGFIDGMDSFYNQIKEYASSYEEESREEGSYDKFKVLDE